MAAQDNKVQIIIEAFDKTRGTFDNLKREMDGLRGSAKQTGDGIGGMFSGLGGKAAAAASAILAVSAALAAIVQKTAQAGEELLQFSKQIGLSVENLGKFKKAAELGESSLEEFVSGMKKFERALANPDAEDNNIANALNAIGLSVKDLRGMKIDDAIQAIGEKFGELEDGPNKTAIAMELFGKNGAALIPMLNEMSDSMQELNSSFTREQAEAADEYGDNLRKLEMQFNAVKTRIGNELIPVLNEFVEMLLGKEYRPKWLVDIQIALSDIIVKFDEARVKAFEFLGLAKMAEMAANSLDKNRESNAALKQERAEMDGPQHHEAVKRATPQMKNLKKGRDLAVDEALNRVRGQLKIDQEDLKGAVDIQKEIWKTQEKEASLHFQRGLIDETEYRVRVQQLREEATALDIAADQMRIGQIEASWAKEKQILEGKKDSGPELAKRTLEVEQELAKVRNDIAKKQEQALQVKIEGDLREIESDRRKADAIRNGSLKVMEAEIALTQKLNNLRVQRGEMSGSAAAVAGKQGEISVVAQRISNLRQELEQGGLEPGELEAINAEIDSLTTNMAALNAELDDLQFQAGGSVWEGMARGFRQVGQEMQESFKNGLDGARNMMGELEGAFASFFDFTSDNFMRLGDTIKNVLSAIYKEIIKVLILKPLMGAISSGLGSLFGSIGGGASGGGMLMSDAWTVGHTGGLVTARGIIPRYHAGGLAGDEIPAILQTGEGVVSRKGMKNLEALNNATLGGGKGDTNVNIVVNNKTGLPFNLKQTGQQVDERTKFKTLYLELIHSDPDFKRMR